MSVLIKGGKMPNSCGHCWLIYSGTDVNGKAEYICVLTEEKRAFEDLFSKRGKYCPLVEIPPHGRLIDADKLCEYARNSTVNIDANDICRFPCVIEAEEQENE